MAVLYVHCARRGVNKDIVYGSNSTTAFGVYLYEGYPEMHSEDTVTRTATTSEVWTDWWLSSAAHYEAGWHSRYGVSLPCFGFPLALGFFTKAKAGEEGWGGNQDNEENGDFNDAKSKE